MTSTYAHNYEFIQKGRSTDRGGASTRIINRFTYGTRGAAPPDNGLAAVTQFVASVGGPFITVMSAGYADDDLLYRCMDDPTNPLVSLGAGLGSGTYGTQTSALSPNYAVYMQLLSGRRGRSYNGSKHFSPVDAGQVDDGELTGAAQILWRSLADALNAPFIAGGVTYVPTIQSQIKSNMLTNPTDVFSSLCDVILVNANLGTMRHRREERATF